MKSHGNEYKTMKFIFRNLNRIKLPHVGVVENLSVPHANGRLISIEKEEDLQYFSSSDSRKKADFYLNGFGVSQKQAGGCQLFNRLQRHDLLGVFKLLNFCQGEEILHKLDAQVDSVHFKQSNRNKDWSSCFSGDQFRVLLNFLMTQGSPNYGISKNRAHFILTSSKVLESVCDLQFHSFEEYFSKFSDKVKIAVRRCWAGQASRTESDRAISLSKKSNNRRWIFDSVIGEPRAWNEDFPKEFRNTAYYLMLEQTN